MAYNPKTGKGLGDLYSAEHRCTKRREWKGLKDTMYDYFRWLKLLGMLGAKLGPVLPQFFRPEAVPLAGVLHHHPRLPGPAHHRSAGL